MAVDARAADANDGGDRRDGVLAGGVHLPRRRQSAGSHHRRPSTLAPAEPSRREPGVRALLTRSRSNSDSAAKTWKMSRPPGKLHARIAPLIATEHRNGPTGQQVPRGRWTSSAGGRRVVCAGVGSPDETLARLSLGTGQGYGELRRRPVTRSAAPNSTIRYSLSSCTSDRSAPVTYTHSSGTESGLTGSPSRD